MRSTIFCKSGIMCPEGDGGAGNKTTGDNVKFGSDTKSEQKLSNQMDQRGWTRDSVKETVNNPYTTRTSVNKATGNSVTIYYNQQGASCIL